MKNKILLKLLAMCAALTMLTTGVCASEIPNPTPDPTEPETEICEDCGNEDCTCEHDFDDGGITTYDGPLPQDDML